MDEFELPGWSHLVYESDALVVLGTYGTVAFLVYFPLGVLVPALRPWAAAASICFHVSIAFFMGLTGFALTMIACDLVFLSDALDRAATRLRTRRRPRPREHAGQEAAGQEAVEGEPAERDTAAEPEDQDRTRAPGGAEPSRPELV
ncbi:hypothetical protein [Streptomyces sp. NPDC007904]|uniref:hypothetical protein n=1 Tax=Streptomyces sp. NPDC007904 TaxID=3364787 RepID=UPI0036ED61B4